MVYYNVKDIPIKQYGESHVGLGKKQKILRWICSGYDIETTLQYTKNDKGKVDYCVSLPYIQQMSINNNDVLFRTYDDFIFLLARISKELDLHDNIYTVIFIHNLSFEFAHMRWYLDNNNLGIKITNVFAKTERKPMKVELSNNIIFLDSALITNSSLKKLAKDYCKTQKLVGDLDYSKQRHQHTKLDPQEEQYCINDVRILSEYSEYYFKTFLSNKKVNENFMPMTSTSIVRHDLKERYKHDPKHKDYMKTIKRLYPRNWKEYQLMMDLFQGGFVHANVVYVSMLLTDVHSFDLKSSYPSILLSKYFPVSQFYNVSNLKHDNIHTIDDMKPYLDEYCCWMRLSLNNLKAKTTHSIISESRAEWYPRQFKEKYNLDNGRFRECEQIVLDLTELDFDLLCKFYTFELHKVIFFRIAKRGQLPMYFRETVAKYYQMKHEISMQIKECKDKEKLQELKKTYAQVKAKLNSLFGCCVTKVQSSNIVYNEGEWSTEFVEDMDYTILKEKSRNPLLPQWGVWCTSWGRFKVLDMIYKLSTNGKNDCAYCDTDSTKILNYEENRYLYDLYNAKQIIENKEFIEEMNLDYDVFYNIGTFEWETSPSNGGCYKHFKTMGAKRYVYEDDFGWHSTIAGLPKNSLQKYCEENNKYLPDVFSQNMLLNEAWSEKLTTYYVDDPTTITVDDGESVEVHEVPSCVCLIPTTFEMSVMGSLLQLCYMLNGNITMEGES